jgi:Ca2+-binding EF-hand superfamily protein
VRSHAPAEVSWEELRERLFPGRGDPGGGFSPRAQASPRATTAQGARVEQIRSVLRENSVGREQFHRMLLGGDVPGRLRESWSYSEVGRALAAAGVRKSLVSCRDMLRRLEPVRERGAGGGGGAGDRVSWRTLQAHFFDGAPAGGPASGARGPAAGAREAAEARARRARASAEDLRRRRARAEKTVDEIGAALWRRGVTLGHLFEMMDADKSNTVTLKEFVHGLRLAGIRLASAEEEMDVFRATQKGAFSEFLLTEAEIGESFFAGRGERSKKAATDSVTRSVSVTDAQREEEEERAVKALERLREQLARRRVGALPLFLRCDEDRSGTVDQREWARGLASCGVRVGLDESERVFRFVCGPRSGTMTLQRLRDVVFPHELEEMERGRRLRERRRDERALLRELQRKATAFYGDDAARKAIPMFRGGDEELGPMTYPEFETGVAGLHEAGIDLSPTLARKIFEIGEPDDDGRLSRKRAWALLFGAS